MKNVVKIIDKQTGEEKTAVYGRNKRGNLRYNVDGRFLPDAVFDRRYSLLEEGTTALSWKVNTPALIQEISANGGPGVAVMRKPLQIFASILGEVAERCLEINDPKLNALMCRLALYEQADPYSKDYNATLTNDTIQKFYNKPLKNHS
jgi:hypothetical protein